MCLETLLHLKRTDFLERKRIIVNIELGKNQISRLVEKGASGKQGVGTGAGGTNKPNAPPTLEEMKMAQKKKGKA